MLPYFLIYSNGHGVSIDWFNDDASACPSMPGYFLNSGVARVETQSVMTACLEFVSKVLGWCQDSTDERVDRLKADWDAITNADIEEQSFSRAAGRMGLDPYAIDTWEPGLEEFIVSDIGSRTDDPIVEDLLEATKPASAKDLWNWVSRTEQSFGLTGQPIDLIPLRHRFARAKDQGYYVARELRQSANLGIDVPIKDLESIVGAVTGKSLLFEGHNHVPDRTVFAAVGWSGNSKAIIVGPEPPRDDNKRFLEARGLYQALIGCRQGARLVTRAHTWDQQAARAFAAELLAPQDALAKDVRSDMETDEREEIQRRLADRYQVSTEVIRLQLANQGSWRDALD
jgi:Zn-dependent peptidase ImmA (M78 family)